MPPLPRNSVVMPIYETCSPTKLREAMAAELKAAVRFLRHCGVGLRPTTLSHPEAAEFRNTIELVIWRIM
jgi:hypothetical protein